MVGMPNNLADGSLLLLAGLVAQEGDCGVQGWLPQQGVLPVGVHAGVCSDHQPTSQSRGRKMSGHTPCAACRDWAPSRMHGLSLLQWSAT